MPGVDVDYIDIPFFSAVTSISFAFADPNTGNAGIDLQYRIDQSVLVKKSPASWSNELLKLDLGVRSSYCIQDPFGQSVV